MSYDTAYQVAASYNAEEAAYLASKFAASTEPYSLITAAVESLAEQAIVQGEIVGETFATAAGPGRSVITQAVSGSAPTTNPDDASAVTYTAGSGTAGRSTGGGY